MFSSNASAVSGDVNYIEDVFSTYLYTGTDAARTITNNIDLSTKGGLVWTKDRSVSRNHFLVDTARGVNNNLSTDLTSAQSTSSTVTAFNTNGFSLSNQSTVNSAPDNYVSWTFRKQPKFFDIVTYTGTGSTQTVAHNLGSVPGCIIVKRTDTTALWAVYHTSTGNTQYLRLDATSAATTSSTYWNNTDPTSTGFTVASSTAVNASGGTYVAYIFADDAGGFGLTGTDNVVSCGSFTTDGSGNATISLGYEPQWMIVKSSSNAGTNWDIIDNMRGFFASSSADPLLFANLSNAETSSSHFYEPTSTGFKASNLSAAATYIYVAIRRGPMKVPTDGTKVFNPSVRASGTGGAVSTTGLGFPPDLLISTERTTGALFAKGWHDRLRGSIIVLSNSTNNEAADSTGVTAYGQDGFSFGADGGFATVNYSGSNYVYEALRRAPSFFDEVCYRGTGANTTQTHNLGVAPELMIIKRRDTTGGWMSYSAALGNTQYLFLNSTSAAATLSTPWNNTSPTASVFSLGTNTNVNASGGTYVAYLFATCSGVSKVGSYTGTATTQQVNCGFTAGARFVMIKRTDSTGDWYVWDTARGIVSGNDPYFLMNTNAAEVTSTDYVDTYAAGFELSSTAPAALNASGGTYLFLAIA